MRFSAVLVALSAVVPFAVATYVKSPESSCKSTEFWWQDKQCCLPNGGSPNPPSPPKGVSCPPSSHYWNHDKSCCVPRYPPHNNQPQPQCNKGYDWYSALYQCLPQPHPYSTTHKPSATPTTPTYPTGYGTHNGGNSGYGNGYGNGGNGNGGNGNGYGSGSGNGGGYGNNGNNHGYGNNGWSRRRRDLKPVAL